MSSGLVLSFVILAVLTASLLFIVQAEGGVSELPHMLQRVGIQLPSPKASPVPTAALPADFSSGNSRFSQGTCTVDSNCIVSGCSGEVCGTSESISTCEFSENFPNAQGLSCSCVKGKCGWR